MSGDKAVDYAERSVQEQYDNLGYTPPRSLLHTQQAGMGGNMMVYLTIGAIAFANSFIKSMTGRRAHQLPHNLHLQEQIKMMRDYAGFLLNFSTGQILQDADFVVRRVNL